jgi:hypothetical protein
VIFHNENFVHWTSVRLVSDDFKSVPVRSADFHL